MKGIVNRIIGNTAPQLVGIASGMALFAAYFVVLAALNSFGHALDQFFSMWYWIVAISAGFGAQIGLYAYIRQSMRAKNAAVNVSATGGISAGSMLACCLHHATDVIPLIGLSAVTLFAAQYQDPFMVLGVASSIVGITMMLNVIQKHKLLGKKSSMRALFGYDMKIVQNAALALSVAAVALSFYWALPGSVSASAGSVLLAAKSDSQNSVTVSVTPEAIVFGRPVKFDISLDTHQGSGLDYDLAKISALKDERGNTYLPVSWTGSPPGGHHRRGTLEFPALKSAKSITLIIKGIYDVPERTFEWSLG